MPDDCWEVEMVKEIIEVKGDQICIENFIREELGKIMESLCSAQTNKLNFTMISLQIFF